MARLTPRTRINQLNLSSQWSGTANAYVLLIERELHEKATKIVNSFNKGLSSSDEHKLHKEIYNYLLDGYTIKKIKQLLKTN